MDLTHVTGLLFNRVPQSALPYCLQLWQEHPFRFTLRRARLSKLGDFSWYPGRPPHITINADSPPLLFLLTYVHEVAHLRVHLQHGRRTAPHGHEWKATFRELAQPLLSAHVFPDDVASALHRHMKNPKASSLTDPHLSKALDAHDHRLTHVIHLTDIPEGSQFEIRRRQFVKGKLNRTRVMCREVSSGRHYLIAANAVINR